MQFIITDEDRQFADYLVDRFDPAKLMEKPEGISDQSWAIYIEAHRNDLRDEIKSAQVTSALHNAGLLRELDSASVGRVASLLELDYVRSTDLEAWRSAYLQIEKKVEGKTEAFVANVDNAMNAALRGVALMASIVLSDPEQQEIQPLLERVERVLQEQLDQVLAQYQSDERAHLSDNEITGVRNFYLQFSELYARVSLHVRSIISTIETFGFGTPEKLERFRDEILSHFTDAWSCGPLHERYTEISEQHFAHIERQQTEELEAFYNDFVAKSPRDQFEASKEALKAAREAGLNTLGDNPLNMIRGELLVLIDSHFEQELNP